MDEVGTSQYYSNHKQVRKQRKKPTGEEIERETLLVEWASQLLHDTPAVGESASRLPDRRSWLDHSQSPFYFCHETCQIVRTKYYLRYC